jgi:hypothetical protein
MQFPRGHRVAADGTLVLHDMAAYLGNPRAWWIPAIALAVGYFTHLFRSFRGTVGSGDSTGYGAARVTEVAAGRAIPGSGAND